jgi:hypothetical protein
MSGQSIHTTEHQYLSGEAYADLFPGVGGFIYAAVLLFTSPDMREAALVFMAISGYLTWRGVRAWRRPYVQLNGDRLVVFERGRPKHYVDLSAVTAVRQRFNRTVLEMRDGLKVSISHLGFMHGEDARHFRQMLAGRFAGAVI